MAAITSKNQLCTLALAKMGLFRDVLNIDSPDTNEEITFSLHYDIVRQRLLRELVPSFARKRRTISSYSETPDFGYSYQYQIPSDCLRVLGIDEIELKENNYSIENGFILHDELFTSGLKLRYISDITDVSKFSPEFIEILAVELAAATVMTLTQDAQKATAIMNAVPFVKSSYSSINAQENRPIKINNSKYRAARYTDYPSFESKK